MMNALLLRRLSTTTTSIGGLFSPITATTACSRLSWYGVQLLSNRSGVPDVVDDDAGQGSILYNGKRDLVLHRGDNTKKLEVSRYQSTFTELSKLGEGSSGEVFLCRHKVDQHLYAIKKDFFACSSREEALMSYLDHPHIVKFYDSWSESSLVHIRGMIQHRWILYIQMEYCKRSLDEYLEKQWLIQISMADRFLTQLLEVVAYLSEEGIVHRDICPVNILMDDKQNIKLADFGQGKFLDECSKESRQSNEVGHRAYVAPEMKPRKFISETVDIYSLGLVYFRLLLHTHVWPKKTLMDSKVLKFRRSRQIPTCMRSVDSNQSAIALIRKMTAPKPWERPSAVNILEAMRDGEDFTTYKWKEEEHSLALQRYIDRIGLQHHRK